MRRLGSLFAALIGCVATESGPSLDDAPTLLAEAVCDAQAACDCAESDLLIEYSTQGECLESYAELYHEDPVPDSTWHPECFLEQVEAVETLGCDQMDSDPRHRGCRALRGPREAGESCTTSWFGHNCRSGLWCSLEGVCVVEQPFDPAGLGESCAGDALCESDLVCRDDVCGELPTAGEACTSRCGEGLECDEGTCRPKAGLGQSCENGCGIGLSCDDDGLCRVAPPAVCSYR